MRKITVLIGISGSGKTTWASEFLAQNPNTMRVNRDDVRMQLTASNSRFLDKKGEEVVSKIVDWEVRTLLQSGIDVLLDNTHLSLKYLKEIDLKFGYMADIRHVFCDVSLEEAQRRVKQRDNISDVTYIKKQYDRYISLKRNYGEFEPIKEHPQAKGGMPHYDHLPNTVICDLDGTLSLYNKNKSAYERDFENDMASEPVLSNLLNFLAFREKGDKIHFFSGRNAKFKKQTLEFLTALGFIPEDDFVLSMRGEDDQRRDSLVKMEMFLEHIPGRFNVSYVIDDRLQVIEECWNRLGVFVFNVNQFNERF
jgi:predicted kinase